MQVIYGQDNLCDVELGAKKFSDLEHLHALVELADLRNVVVELAASAVFEDKKQFCFTLKSIFHAYYERVLDFLLRAISK